MTRMMTWHYWIARNSTLLSGAVIYVNRFLACYYRLLSFLLRNSREGFIRIFLLVIQESWGVFFIRRDRGSFEGIFFIKDREREEILLINFRIMTEICCMWEKDGRIFCMLMMLSRHCNLLSELAISHLIDNDFQNINNWSVKKKK